MTGSENIVQRILEQAREQVQSMEQDAKAKAEQEVAAATKQAMTQAEVIIAHSEAEKAEREKRILSVADLELRKRRLAAKRQVLDEAYNKAAGQLAALPDDKYAQAYVGITAEALVKGTEGIAPAAADKDRLGAAFIEKVNAALKAKGKTANVQLLAPRADIPGGCIVCDGGMEIDYSHKAVMRSLREGSEAEVARALFGEEG